jgi:hypothetical protein
MPLDHYVSQVHLRNFYSAVTQRLFGIKKSDLKTFPCRSEDVCRIEDGSTNAYLTRERAIEDFLLSVEPRYNTAIATLRDGNPDRDCIYVVAGFAAYVSSCAPAAMRIGTPPLKAQLDAEARRLDKQGVFEKAPPSLGGKSMTELLDDGTVNFSVDQKYPQALGISGITYRQSVWGNSSWEVLRNTDPDVSFCTSDFPVAIEHRPDGGVNRIVPLAPDLAVRIIPDNRLRGAPPDLSFGNFSCRYRPAGRADVVGINRTIVQCAEEVVFFRDDTDWVKPFVSKNRYFRIETVIDQIRFRNRVVPTATQRIVERRPASSY